MTTEMLTVAVITAHGHQCKTVDYNSKDRNNNKNGSFQSPQSQKD